jgi:hypothetical protein
MRVGARAIHDSNTIDSSKLTLLSDTLRLERGFMRQNGSLNTLCAHSEF